jgi:NADPH-dependent 2,4-dienoyl-CoA reductase/sulfur reductase-like enzyme
MTTTSNGRRSLGDGIVIVGGGLSGQRCVEALRRGGHEGPIRVVCSEPHRPYDRPPLSKAALIDATRDAGLTYRSAEWYGEQSVDLLLGVSATGLRPAERRVRLSDGASLRYQQLLIATGGRPRTLPVLSGCDNVSVLRTIDDARVLRDVLAAGPRLAVIGAGFIGLEIAATARRLGVEVTIVEAGPCPLAGIVGAELGEWFGQLHADEGVHVLTDVTVDRVDGNGSVRALRLSDGVAVAVDHVVVGVGIQPDVAWLAGSGLDFSAGVPVDPHGRTAIEGLFAAGDAAATFDERCGRYVPGSHWEAAGRQGARVARAMLGLDPGTAPLTSFWTDQYGLRIQYLGRRRPGDDLQIDGDPRSRNFTATFSRAGRAVAALLVDRPRFLPAARNLIEKGTL